MTEQFNYNEKGEVIGMHREPQNWELELLEYAKLQGTENSKEWRKLIAFINQNRKELVEEILADIKIPYMDLTELKQQLRDKYLNN